MIKNENSLIVNHIINNFSFFSLKFFKTAIFHKTTVHSPHDKQKNYWKNVIYINFS